MKKKIAIFIIFLLIALGAYGYYLLSGILETNKKAEEILTENTRLKTEVQNLDKIKEAVIKEKNRCQQFISREEGDFGDFEYCKDFIEWADNKELE